MSGHINIARSRSGSRSSVVRLVYAVAAGGRVRSTALWLSRAFSSCGTGADHEVTRNFEKLVVTLDPLSSAY